MLDYYISTLKCVGINSQTQQTSDEPSMEALTLVDEEPVIYIDENDEDWGRPVKDILKHPLIFGCKKKIPTTKDQDGYDTGASCSNQRGEEHKGAEGPGL